MISESFWGITWLSEDLQRRLREVSMWFLRIPTGIRCSEGLREEILYGVSKLSMGFKGVPWDF